MSIILSGISKSYNGQSVVENFSYQFPNNGVVCLFGPSGCGKTTLLKLIAGSEKPDQGKIIKNDLKISYIFQEDRLLPWLSARENVNIVLDTNDRSSGEKFLVDVGLSESMDKLPGELSGGMQRRVTIARSLAYGGDVFLLDEVFKGIDMSLKKKIADIFTEIAKEKLVIMVTHDLKEAKSYSDKVLYVEGPPLRVVD